MLKYSKYRQSAWFTQLMLKKCNCTLENTDEKLMYIYGTIVMQKYKKVKEQ